MKRVMTGALVAGLATAGTGVLVMRDELNRYIRMKRSATRPEFVGVSITPQGNEAALGRSEERRRRDREVVGVRPGQPSRPEMPNLRPGDQGG